MEVLTNLTLLTKVYNRGQLKQIEMSLQATFENLDAQVQVLDKTVNRWVKVNVTGEDGGVAKSYIAKQIGVCPSIEEVIVNAELRGYLQKINTSDGLTVDVGILEPKPVSIRIPLAALQMQLFGGRDVALKKIVELFALSTDLPVSVKVKKVHIAENVFEAEFSAAQLELFKNWQDSLLDRLLILGITTDEVMATLERTRLSRDVISVDALGLFEQVLTCKLGTDATGLIPRIGRYVRNTQLLIFNPKKLVDS